MLDLNETKKTRDRRGLLHRGAEALRPLPGLLPATPERCQVLLGGVSPEALSRHPPNHRSITMRAGRVFKRCGKCNRAIQPGQRTCSCGWKSSSWTFVVDLNAPGEPRRQMQKGGFATAQQAQAAMTKLQSDKAEGTFIEPSRQTVGAFLTTWLAGKDRLRASTRTSYANAVKRLLPIIGAVAL